MLVWIPEWNALSEFVFPVAGLLCWCSNLGLGASPHSDWLGSTYVHQPKSGIWWTIHWLVQNFLAIILIENYKISKFVKMNKPKTWHWEISLKNVCIAPLISGYEYSIYYSSHVRVQTPGSLLERFVDICVLVI